MADQKLTQLAALASLSADDLFYVVDDPAGAALSRKMAASVLDARYLRPLDIGVTVQAWDDDLDTIAGLAKTDGNFIVGDGAAWVVESGATVRTSLGLVAGGAGDIWVEKAGDTMTGALNINVSTATVIGLTLKTTDDNTTNPLFRILDSSNNVKSAFKGNGYLGVGTGAPFVRLDVQGTDFTAESAMAFSGASASTNIINDYAGLQIINTDQTNGNYVAIQFADAVDPADQFGFGGIYGIFRTHAQSAAIRGDIAIVTRSGDGFKSRFVVESNGRVAIGPNSSAFAQFNVEHTSGAAIPAVYFYTTNLSQDTIWCDVGDIPVDGSSPGLLFSGKSSTSFSQNLARFTSFWTEPTHGIRKARSVWSVYDTAEREGIRIEADGTAPMIGFYGSNAVAVQTVTGSRGGNAALADLLTKLATLGLIIDGSS